MSYVPFNLTIVQGDDADPVVFKFDQMGTPVDISGWTIFYTVKEAKDSDSVDSTAEFKYDSVNDTSAIVKSDSGSGTTDQFTINIQGSDTGAVTAGDYYHDVQRKDASGDIWTLAMGTLTVEGDVTRRTTT